MYKLNPSLVVLLALLTAACGAAADTPWAASVVSYTPGLGAVYGYTDAAKALGPPSRVVDRTDDWGFTIGQTDVTMFESPFMSNEVAQVVSGERRK